MGFPHESSSTCVICQRLYDRKPCIDGGDEFEDDSWISKQEEGQRRQKFTEEVFAALKIFVKLLKSKEEDSGGEIIGELLETLLSWEMSEGSLWGPPCCDECSGTLISVLRLQQVIEQNQAIQLESVVSLKSSLMDSVSSGDNFEANRLKDSQCWLRIRNLLVECLKPPQVFQGKRKRGRPPGKKLKQEIESSTKSTTTEEPTKPTDKEPPEEFGDEQRTTLQQVKLEHFEDCTLPVDYPETEAGGISATVETDCTSRRSKRNAKRRLAANDVTSESESDFSCTNKPFSLSKRIKQKKGAKKDMNRMRKKERINTVQIERESRGNNSSGRMSNDFNEGLQLAEFSSSSHCDEGDISSGSENISRVAGKEKKKVPHGKHIYFLSVNNFLLFKYTPIQLSHTDLSCRESGCSVTIPGTDFDSLQKLKAHIVDCHSQWSKTPARCPICFLCVAKGGPKLRNHIVKFHQQRRPRVVCESCWRPIDKGKVPAHTWEHKSLQEKAEALARGEKDPKTYDYTHLQPISVQQSRRSEFVHKRKKVNKVQMYQSPFYHYMYFLTVDNFLLFKYTLIKFSHTELCCRAFGCSITIQGTDFNAFQKLRAHIEDCHTDQKWCFTKGSCPICTTPISSAGRKFRSHILAHHHPSEASIVCESCWMPLNRNNVQDHLWSHKSREEQADCLAKGERVPPTFKHTLTTAEIEDRKDEDTNTTWKVECKQCGKCFRSRAALVKHEESHLPREQRKLFPCPDCPGLSYTTKAYLNNHIKVVHQKKPKPLRFVCSICDQRLHSRGNLEDHMRSAHTGERPFQCEECGKAFTSKYILDIHSIAHSSERPFQCEHCPMSYKHKRNLQQHQRTSHKDLGLVADPVWKMRCTPAHKRPAFIGPKIAYPCEYCDKYFEMRCRLTQHVNKYHADKAA